MLLSVFFFLSLSFFPTLGAEYLCSTGTSVNIRSSRCTGAVQTQANIGDRFQLKDGVAPVTQCGYTWVQFSDNNWAAQEFFKPCFPAMDICADTWVNIRSSPCGTKLSTASPGDQFTTTGTVSYDPTDCSAHVWNELSDGSWAASTFFHACTGAPPSDPDDQPAYLTTRVFEVSESDIPNFCFPIGDGFYHNTRNFGQSRVKFSFRGRCHPGVDLLTRGTENRGMVRAITEGEIILVSTSWYKCKSGRTKNTRAGTYEYVGALYVYNEVMDLTFVYGEINWYELTGRKVGQRIRKGERLGVASKCSMLHLEMYRGKGRNHGTGTYRGRNAYGWLLYDNLGMSALPRGNNICWDRSNVKDILDDIGSELLNPLSFIDQISGNTGPECASRPTYAVRNSMEMKMSDLADDLFPPPEDEMSLFGAGLSAGETAGIVIGVLLSLGLIVGVTVAIVVIVWCVCKRRQGVRPFSKAKATLRNSRPSTGVGAASAGAGGGGGAAKKTKTKQQQKNLDMPGELRQQFRKRQPPMPSLPSLPVRNFRRPPPRRGNV